MGHWEGTRDIVSLRDSVEINNITSELWLKGLEASHIDEV